MTIWRVNITRTDDAGPDAYRIRNELAASQHVTHSVLFDNERMSTALRSHVVRVSGSLDSKAAKMGLKPIRDETQYGIHGAGDGSIEFWVQRTFA